MFVDLLLSKHKHNGAAAQRFLLMLGAPFDARQLCTTALRRRCVASLTVLTGDHQPNASPVVVATATVGNQEDT